MLASVVRIGKLFGIAIVLVPTLFGGLLGWFRFKNWQSESFQEQYAYLLPIVDELSEIERNALDAGIDHPSIVLDRILTAPKIVAITHQVNRNSTFLSRRSNSVDPLMNSLESAWIPKTIDEVNLILTLRWCEASVGSYADGSVAYQEYCDFRLYDRHSGQLLLEGRGAGALPSGSKRRSSTRSDQFGGFADDDVVKLLKGELEEIKTNFKDRVARR
ncbi:MAG: hypothetical protein R3C09_20445 [Pirellulaceae bacterium]|jgi:hypothetical protein